jgi:hypothetical protein
MSEFVPSPEPKRCSELEPVDYSDYLGLYDGVNSLEPGNRVSYFSDGLNRVVIWYNSSDTGRGSITLSADLVRGDDGTRSVGVVYSEIIRRHNTDEAVEIQKTYNITVQNRKVIDSIYRFMTIPGYYSDMRDFGSAHPKWKDDESEEIIHRYYAEGPLTKFDCMEMVDTILNLKC